MKKIISLIFLLTLALMAGTVTASATLTYSINPTKVEAGGFVTLSIMVKNTGSADLTDLFAVLYIPKTLTIISTNPAVHLNDTTSSNEVYIWDIGSLNQNELKELDINAKVDENVADVISTTAFVFEPIVGGTRQIANTSVVVYVPSGNSGSSRVITTTKLTTTTLAPTTTTVLPTTTTNVIPTTTVPEVIAEQPTGVPTGMFTLTPISFFMILIGLGITSLGIIKFKSNIDKSKQADNEDNTPDLLSNDKTTENKTPEVLPNDTIADVNTQETQNNTDDTEVAG